ncbi:amino acid ABC transporter substrate-binding component [Fructilactobacillus fructivorans]|nr:amino acid ABC transporter substrate-binding component [Fructilactobacillus fructivorans]KRN39713.1 amino acid ABC transporter substrate-binding component [Fructilactobacillus fructivorans]
MGILIMKKRWPLLLLTGVAALALTVTACGKQSETKKPGTLTVGMEGTYAPYSYKDKNGKLTGFEVDLAKDVAKKMGMKVQYKLTGWDSLIQGLNSNSYDVIFNNMAINPSRKKQYRFATPYIYSKSIMITKKGSPIKNAQDFKGKKVAEGTGTDNWDNAEKLHAKPVSSPEFNTSMQMIDQGRVSGAINAQPAWQTWYASHKDTDLQAKLIPTNIIPQGEIAPMMNKKSAKLNKQMDKALNELRKDGTLKRLSMKYFGENITDK